jgi:TRAP-type C4-dicarboxylate transport system permease large subunit
MRTDQGSIMDVFSGVLPFVLLYIGAIALLMMVPGLALWLPGILAA